MIIKYRVENVLTEIELTEKEADGFSISLSVEKEELQEKINEEFNRPEYNNWHKETRHLGEVKAMVDGELQHNTDEALLYVAKDKTIFNKDEIDIEKRDSFETWERRIKENMKEEYADVLIQIILHGMSVKEYADYTGISENNASKRYRRAINKFKELFPKSVLFS